MDAAAKRLTFGQRVLHFNAALHFDAPVPPGIGVMNPFQENECANTASEAFYNKYYGDFNDRHIILGINPGRFGAGITGVPFTDPNHLRDCCHIDIAACGKAHEPSSQFIYNVIATLGGPERFYKSWYINSLCPLGFTIRTDKGVKNYNYYDSPGLEAAALPFIVKTLKEQISFGIYQEECICLGTGANAAFMRKLNAEYNFFGRITALEHPRWIIQYRAKRKDEYLEKYARTLGPIAG